MVQKDAHHDQGIKKPSQSKIKADNSVAPVVLSMVNCRNFHFVGNTRSEAVLVTFRFRSH